ncbi:M48 family metallopeptidase [Hydrogenophaga sp. PAMC20947]|uniref:M48 family metallopeptidase n=1 Tax=Hydrogenophaga sp. PAMC20947 TaxID=2565558 RepID=UPI001447EC62|nr:M48 family metallopeptidase [Hydrogenophaga sp. PAMC20947]
MNQTDFLHLVRTSEIDAQEKPAAYRRTVAWFATLGYFYAVASVALGAALIFFAWLMFDRGRYVPTIGAGLGGAGLCWVALGALFTRITPPDGLELTRDQAPELFRALDRLRKRLDGPPIHRVVIHDEYNAYITQQPLLGLVGPVRNTLGVGLPLLLTIDKPRFLAVLAHEYAHLRGGDGRLATWLYRSRKAWSRLADQAFDRHPEQDDVYAWLTRGFVHWYAPRLAARSFALARQEEYTADRAAARLVGTDTQVHALLEIALRAPQMSQTWWHSYWAQATTHAEPELKPYAWLATRKLAPPTPDELERGLASICAELSHHADTHPTTRERVEALKAPLALPPMSRHHAGALLGENLPRVIRHFDQAWWVDHQVRWQAGHRRAQRDLARIAELKPRLVSLDAPSTQLLAQWVHRVHGEKQALPLFRLAVQRNPNMALARWRLALAGGRHNNPEALEHLQWLAQHCPHMGRAAAQEALALIDRLPFQPTTADDRRAWRAQLRQFETLEAAAEQAVSSEADLLEQVQLHDLSADECFDLGNSLSPLASVRRLWIMRRPCPVFAERRQYVVVVELRPGADILALSPDDIERQLQLPGPAWVVYATTLRSPEFKLRKFPLGEPLNLGGDVNRPPA